MRIRSLRALIIGSLLAVHLALTGALLIVAGDFARQRQHGYARDAMAGTLEDVTDQVTRVLKELARVVTLTQGLAEAELLQTDQQSSLERYFFEILQTNPEVTGAYYGTRAGDFVFVTREAPALGRNGRFFSRTMVGEDAGRRSVVRLREADFGVFAETEVSLAEPFDPRHRPWFGPALQTEQVVWTEPYFFYTAGRLGLSAAIRVPGPDGLPTGVVGTDLSLSSLQDFVDQLRVGKTGYAFLLDARGRAISHPALGRGTARPPALSALGELHDPVLTRLAGRLTGNDEALPDSFAVVGADGTDYLVMARRLSTRQGDWTIGAVLPERDLFGWFQDLSDLVILLSIGLSLLWCLAGLLLWRYIDRRFERLRALADRILSRKPTAPGDLPADTPATHSFTELGDAERAVEQALAALDRQRLEKERLLDKAQQSDRAKTLFLASMSHELRTPLNAIGGFAEIIEREMLGPIGIAKYRDYAELIGRSNRRMLELVKNLLDASALELGTMELRCECTDLDEVVAEAAEEQRLDARQRGLHLTTESNSGLTLLVDAPKIRMLLANLLRNALAYTPSGGSVRLQASLNGAGRPVIEVADTGVGMEPEQLEQLRKPFARGLDNAYVASETGTGLGLSIVDRIVDLHRAKLHFETAPGRGTRVSVTFPRNCVLEQVVQESG